MQSIIKRSFALVKKPKMELTIRTPYKAFVESFTGFTRVITRTTEATLVVQNRMPPAVHMLPPGSIKLKSEREIKGFSGELVHMGGWLVIHPDNSCDINLMDAVDKKDMALDKVGKAELPKDSDAAAMKYIERIRNTTQRTFLKNA